MNRQIMSWGNANNIHEANVRGEEGNKLKNTMIIAMPEPPPIKFPVPPQIDDIDTPMISISFLLKMKDGIEIW